MNSIKHVTRYMIMSFATFICSCNQNKVNLKMIEKKWKFDTVYSKDLDNYIADRKRELDTTKNETVKKEMKHNVDMLFDNLLKTTLQFNEDSSMEEGLFVMGRAHQLKAKWLITDDGKKLILDVPPQKNDTIIIHRNDTTTTITIAANEGEKDTFNIAEITTDKLVLKGKAQLVGNGTIVLKRLK